jgi:DNA-binding CsgD family transcriptional regulator
MTDTSHNIVKMLLFAATAILVGSDLLADAGSGASGFHLGLEGAGTLVALVGAAWSSRQLLAERKQAQIWRAQAEELLAGVGNTVEQQFAEWHLSPAEAEVAWLLLKGLSFKEAAAVRKTTERTSREQARSVYKKAGVAGRAELSAWFLEDLLQPSEG